jgi:hypothetical protein
MRENRPSATAHRVAMRLDADALNARYFRDRVDGLQVGSLAHLMNARV